MPPAASYRGIGTAVSADRAPKKIHEGSSPAEIRVVTGCYPERWRRHFTFRPYSRRGAAWPRARTPHGPRRPSSRTAIRSASFCSCYGIWQGCCRQRMGARVRHRAAIGWRGRTDRKAETRARVRLLADRASRQVSVSVRPLDESYQGVTFAEFIPMWRAKAVYSTARPVKRK
jgi:hypothetical protein